jgi:hypothetical protein
MMRKCGLLVIILLLSVTVPASGAVKVDWEATVSGNDLTTEQGLAWDTGFRLTGDWTFGEKLTFFLRDKMAINSNTQEWAGDLERCYLRYESGAFRANLGRQAVGWGIGWFFRPTDLITPITPLAQEETRLGKDMAVLRWSTSPLTAIDLIAGDRLYAARGELRWGDTNIRLMGVSEYQKISAQTVNNLGWDVQGGLAGLYTEGKFTCYDSGFADGKTTALVGWRKMVWSDRQLFVEYLLNNDPMYSGHNYLATGLQIPYDELTSFSITGVANLDDGGCILDGIADLQLSDSLDLRGMIVVFTGRDTSEFMIKTGGARWNIVLQVKYYF